MLGEIIYEEKGRITGTRVVSADDGEIKIEVDLQTEGKIQGVEETCVWTYWSKTRSDGTMVGEGKGFMTTKDGDVITLIGSGCAPGAGSDGSVHYRGAIYFHTTSQKYAGLNGTAGVHEYDVDADGNTAVKVWEWK